jgi:hypothetical protein
VRAFSVTVPAILQFWRQKTLDAIAVWPRPHQMILIEP